MGYPTDVPKICVYCAREVDYGDFHLPCRSEHKLRKRNEEALRPRHQHEKMQARII